MEFNEISELRQKILPTDGVNWSTIVFESELLQFAVIFHAVVKVTGYLGAILA